MFIGLNSKQEKDILRAFKGRHMDIPLMALAVLATVGLALILGAYFVDAFLAPAPAEVVEWTRIPDVALRCAHRCISIR